MAKPTYASMKLKVDTKPTKITFNDTEIEVLQYLPINDKYDLIMITLQNAYEEGIYNPLKLDMYFHLYMIYMYTNINFTEKQKEDETKIYDTLTSNGLISEVLKYIPENEYQVLFTYMQEIIDEKMKYNTSASALLQSFINDLPTQAQAALDIVENFDPDKFQAVKDFAKAANGGRDIN